MGLLEKIFTKKATQTDVNKPNQQLELLNAYMPTFQRFSSGVYETEITRSAIHTKAKHCAKLLPETKGSANLHLNKILKHKPNPFQNTYQFLYRIATILAVNTYCFIIPLYERDGPKRIVGYFPILPSNTDLLDLNGVIWLRYTFANGRRAAIEYDKVGVMSEFQFKNDLWGDGHKPLQNTMDLLDMQRQGITEGIKQGAMIRFMASLDTTLRPEDLEKERENFTMKNLSTENNTGVMMYDAKYKEVKQIESKPFIIDKDNLEYIKNNIYNYFGVNEDIMQNKFDEDKWNAFYEGEIEPFALQLSLVLTNMTYSDKEISMNNEIFFTANKLQYASNKTKIEITTQLFDRGIITDEQAMDMWGVNPNDKGQRYIRKEYAEKEHLNDYDSTTETIKVEEEIDDNKG